MAKRDISALLKEKATARAQEMATTQNVIKNGKTAGRPSDGEKRKCISLNLKEESHKRLKLYAVQHDISASALVEEWIQKYCVD